MMEEFEIDEELVPASAMESSNIIKSGVLMKKGTGLVYRPWNRRTISIDTQNRLSYYDAGTLRGDNGCALGELC